DFGERIPTDVQWFDGSDPQKMHNHYAYIYNELVWNVLKETVGADMARGALTGVARRNADGSWVVENLRLNDIRLQSDKSLS
ncbi:hypothetical protein KU617_23770, partial [Salmonella enterica subsp. enterica serovar Montevideo]|nr:hypothetical protein [Salmonella enterica subsp. enterica serovar Montevideo]